MKVINKIIEAIFNPLFTIITANGRSSNNKGVIQTIKKSPLLLLLISLIITVAIVLIAYRKEIFGV